MRGLKHEQNTHYNEGHKVASFTDAWIETFEVTLFCGQSGVASFTDAWIETKGIGMIFTKLFVASFTDAWIETVVAAVNTGAERSHLLQMRGLKLLKCGKINHNASRIFYRCVD